MTAIEQRLRVELGELAELMVPSSDHEIERSGLKHLVDAVVLPTSERRVRPVRRWILAAAAALVVVGAATLVVSGGDAGTSLQAGPAVDAGTVGFGTWQPMATAPIPPRSHAVTAWTGDEVVFWAGSNTDRTVAYSDGAAYDPVSDSWQIISVPGWGHPGLTSAFDGEQLYVLAKGGASRFDPVSGIWSDLPDIRGRFARAVIAADGAVWVLGPANAFQPADSGQTDIALARFDEGEQLWTPAPNFEGVPADAAALVAMTRLEIQPLWTGSEIVVWNPKGGGPAFDPSTETWRRIPAPVPESGRVVDSTAVVTGTGLVAIVEIEDGDRTLVSLATLAGNTWSWTNGAALPVMTIDGLSVAGAGDWLVLLRADGSPVIVQVSSGAWEVASDSPLGGLIGASTVWTGSEMVIWGGVATPLSGREAPPVGAIWTPSG